MFETFKNSFKVREIRNKILLTILFVIIYRLGCFIPVPGLDMSSISLGDNFSLYSIMNAISGSALSQGTLFAIGISPYINASIIMQLLTIAIPALERMSKDGDEGKAKIEKITRYATVVLAAVNALGVLLTFRSEGILDTAMLGANFVLPEWVVFVYTMIILMAGSMLCMWIGERITEFGVSNGISILIFVGILSTAGTGILGSVKNIIEFGFAPSGFELVGFVAVALIIFAFITWVDGGERRIKVQYAKQIKGNKVYGGQATVIPVRINASGVLPLIFAFAIMSFPSMLLQTFWPASDLTAWWATYMTSTATGSANDWVGTLVYTVLLSVFIFVFAYFYSQVQFNPIDISKNLQQSGGFIPGIRPGRETSEYLQKVVSRITLWGAVFLAILALIPSLIFGLVTSDSGLLNAFSSTGMLIIVSVALEFDKSLENQIMMRHYKGFLK